MRDLLKRANFRVKRSMGDTFQKDILDDIPLVLTDDIAVGIASKFGWDPTWMAKKESKKRRPTGGDPGMPESGQSDTQYSYK